MGQPGPEDDFYAYTQEWTKSISKGGLFEVSNVTFLFFWRLEVLMRQFLTQHLLIHTIAREDVTKAVIPDEDLLCMWDTLSGPLSHGTSQSLLKEITDLWMTIRGHAFTKQLTEKYKYETKKGKSKSKSFRAELEWGQ